MSNERFTAKRTGSCNRCGSDAVAWCRSFKTGRAYLVNVAADGTASRQDVHSATCAGTLGANPKMVNGAPLLNACLALTGEMCHCPSCEDSHKEAMAAEIAALRSELADAKATNIAPAPLTVDATLELAAIATPEPVAAPVPVVATDLLETAQDHAYMEVYIASNRAEIEAKLNRMLSNTGKQQSSNGVAVLDKPEPVAAAPEIVEALAEPKEIALPKMEIGHQHIVPNHTGQKRGTYKCSNTDCMVDSWVATVTPGKPHTCLHCGRIAKFTGLV